MMLAYGKMSSPAGINDSYATRRTSICQARGWATCTQVTLPLERYTKVLKACYRATASMNPACWEVSVSLHVTPSTRGSRTCLRPSWPLLWRKWATAISTWRTMTNAFPIISSCLGRPYTRPLVQARRCIERSTSTQSSRASLEPIAPDCTPSVLWIF